MKSDLVKKTNKITTNGSHGKEFDLENLKTI